MEIERVHNNTGRTELYAYEWDMSNGPAQKAKRIFIGYEQPVKNAQQQSAVMKEAICWSYGRTLGNITVSNEQLLGNFPSTSGEDAILECDIVDAGKMRNGNPRWWCRTHQKHWGTKADIAAAVRDEIVRCSNHSQLMSYVIDPEHIDIQNHAEVGIWCSMPPAITNMGNPAHKRKPRIHVHVRDVAGQAKSIDRDYVALSLLYNSDTCLFGSQEISKVHLTPPAALEFVLALESGKAMGCIDCKNCFYPHLDLGSFARKVHVKHLCGNCGKDNTWSKKPISSTPLMPLHEQFSRANTYTDVTKSINLEKFTGLRFQIWASTPAVLWTAQRPQERGIHVHVYTDDDKYLIDDTYGEVIFEGRVLNRAELLQMMVDRTIS